MHLVYQGILWGLTLSVLIGPMFFMLLQLGAERGMRAGAMAGSGAWTSDMLIIALIFMQMDWIGSVSKEDNFKLYTGLIGGGLLLLMGGAGLIRTFVTAPEGEKAPSNLPKTAWGLWVGAFMTNTFNPFNVFFWLSVMGTVSLQGTLSVWRASVFFGTLMGVLIATDMLKVLLAKRISRFMTPLHLIWMRRVSSVSLVIFGLWMLWRVWP